MTTRSTTLVESDQLAQAAVEVIRNEDFVPKGKRWPFSRTSKAQRDYEKTVLQITTRRREARENAVELKLKKERNEADAILERAKQVAQAAYDEKIGEAKKPFEETETKARVERDAAIAAANRAYELATEQANRVYQQEALAIDEVRHAAVADASGLHKESYAQLEARREVELAQISKDLKTVPLEGPMRIVEDREAWSLEERKKALIGIVDMAGRDDFTAEYTELCLRNVSAYVFHDRYLKPEAQHHRLMDANLLEAVVDLAARTPERRPSIVKYLNEIVAQNPGHSSPIFIKKLTELYVSASADVETIYDVDMVKNETIFEDMRAHIADTLKLTPRRNQVPSASGSVNARDTVAAGFGDDEKTPVMLRGSQADITSDMNMDELIPVDPSETFTQDRKS